MKIDNFEWEKLDIKDNNYDLCPLCNESVLDKPFIPKPIHAVRVLVAYARHEYGYKTKLAIVFYGFDNPLSIIPIEKIRPDINLMYDGIHKLTFPFIKQVSEKLFIYGTESVI